MARTAGLRQSRAARLAALAVLVVLAHLLLVQLMWHTITNPSQLRAMATPMFTRTLAPQAPAVIAASPRVLPKRTTATRAKAATRKNVSDGPAKSPTEPEAAPQERPATQPQPVPVQVEAPLESTASAPAAQAESSASTAAPGTSHVQSWPADTRLTYRLSGSFRGPIHGKAQVQWQRESERYQVRVEIDPNLLPGWMMTSQGDILAEGLSPQIYEERQLNRTRTVILGPSGITLNDGRSLPRPPGVQDTASQFIELSHRFAMGQAALTVPGQVTMWLARPGAVDEWTYDIAGPEFLETSLGRLETYHLKPRPIANPRGNITPEIWFAPGLLYLPVRIRVNQGDENHVDLLIEQIEQR